MGRYAQNLDAVVANPEFDADRDDYTEFHKSIRQLGLAGVGYLLKVDYYFTPNEYHYVFQYKRDDGGRIESMSYVRVYRDTFHTLKGWDIPVIKYVDPMEVSSD